ncbi:hypothetical protein [Methylobacter psychrophilus]|nr:hypothetical protein [Methylobacter psychrophilus]
MRKNEFLELRRLSYLKNSKIVYGFRHLSQAFIKEDIQVRRYKVR